MKNYLLLIPFFLLPFLSFSQEYYTLRGYVYSENNEPLTGVAVRVVNSNTGTATNAQGKYEIKLLEGLNRISVSSMGYQTEVFEVVADKDLVKNIFLKIDHKQLDEVVVKVKKKDESYEVIKRVLENKEAILNQYQNYRAKAYIKSVEEVEKKVVKKKDEDVPPNPGEQLQLSEKAPAKKDSLPNLNIFECRLTRAPK